MSKEILPNKLVVVAAIIDGKSMTLYDDNGNTYILSTNDFQTKEIMDEIIPQIAKNNRATLVLNNFRTHKVFEEKTNGLVKFFRVAKNTVGGIFDKALPSVSITDIMKAGEGNEVTDNLTEEDTIVAVVDGKAIPNMEKIVNHFKRSNSGSQKGMSIFLKRLSKIIDQRGHSVEDLLKFLEKADLPIAEDGTVVAYKSLKHKSSEGTTYDPDVYYDIHSGKVAQGVGSYVYMDIKSVDPSRKNDCSHGLHIARRDYIGQFSGDVCVICKIPPENFIAVPEYSPSKVRVSGYHIVAEVNDKGRSLLRNNKPMTQDSASAKLLAEVIAGKHIPITEKVFIGGPRGTEVQINAVKESVLLKNLERAKSKKTTERKVAALDDQRKVDVESMKPKAVNQKINEIKEQAKTDSMNDAQKTAFKLIAEGYTKTEVANAVATSTRTLGRWMDKFGIEMPAQKVVTEKAVTIVDGTLQDDAEFLDEVTAPSEVNEIDQEDLEATAEMAPEITERLTQKEITKPASSGRSSLKDEARKLYHANRYADLVAFKKAKKKSWSALGFSQSEENNLLNWISIQK